MRSIDKIDREFLSDLFSVATYGCSWLAVRTLKSESELDQKFSEDYLERRCIEDKWADRLLSGGHVVFYDLYEIEDGNEEEARHVITLEDVVKGLEKARDGEDPRDFADFINEDDDYYTGNNLLQIILFGEVVYG